MPWLLGIQDSVASEIEIGGQRLYRPKRQIQHQLRLEAENHLREAYCVGTYTDPQKISEILQYQFSFYENILNDKLPLIASRHLLEFVLSQYDIAARIERQFKNGKLNASDATLWRELGPVTRRSMKYLAEMVTRLSPPENSPAPIHSLFHVRDIVWICSEHVLKLGEVADQTFFVVPDQTVFEIFPEGTEIYTRLSVRNFDDHFFRRVSFSRDNEGRFLPKPDFEVNLDVHFNFINDAFRQTFGATYEEILECLLSLVDDMPAEHSQCNIPISPKQWVIEQTANALSIPEEAAGRLLAGFTLTKQAMDAEGRVAWKPNQEHRAFYRAFFEILNEVGPMLMWSREMARESLFHLSVDMVHQRVAPEWNNNKINQAAAHLSNAYGAWFEGVSADNFKQLGFEGVQSRRKSIGIGDRQLAIPREVGEIDYLGYSFRESLLVIAECKANSIGAESRFFRKELTQFLNGKRSYTARFRRKIKWVKENWRAICQALESEPDLRGKYPISPKSLAAIMVTRRPTIAADFTEGFPCVSLTELRMAHAERNCWPYELGGVARVRLL